jgi:hypothetical protein
MDNADGSTGFGLNPVDVVVQQPAVTVQQIELSATFARDAMGLLRGDGSLTSTQLILGTTPSGQGTGTMSALLIPAGKSPTGIPTPMSLSGQ